ncbi:zinc finger protein 62 homolog isoform X2 [Neocloeon triangulifer]|uniref:zinc finger protein 62 homolog isoform X2 n=1 Tax=Neocloeon triangulifer TaxID=2078957 RepID=UPI00286F3781|nr:zinc finger protein 62 homolog isoform X2 [Neocloeon triangulifer]
MSTIIDPSTSHRYDLPSTSQASDEFSNNNFSAKDKQCQFCNKKFGPTEENLYFSHVAPTQCSRCAEVFDCQSKFDAHNNKDCLQTESKKRWLCNFCLRFASTSRLKHTNYQTSCTNCKMEFACVGLAEIHRQFCNQEKQNPPEKWFTCDFCLDSFKSELNHFRYKRSVTCRNCQKSFKCRGLCNQHKIQCCNFLKCKVCGKNFKEKQGQKKHTRKRQCQRCNHVSQCFNSFRAHDCPGKADEEEIAAETATLEKCRFCHREIFEGHSRQVKCPKCKILQNCSTLYGRHVEKCLSEEFQCDECEKSFEKKSKLNSHKQRRHVQPKVQEQILELLKEKRDLDFVQNYIVKREPIEIINMD